MITTKEGEYGQIAQSESTRGKHSVVGNNVDSSRNADVREPLRRGRNHCVDGDRFKFGLHRRQGYSNLDKSKWRGSGRRMSDRERPAPGHDARRNERQERRRRSDSRNFRKRSPSRNDCDRHSWVKTSYKFRSRSRDFSRREENGGRKLRSNSFSSSETYIETEEERRLRWDARWKRERHGQPPRPFFPALSTLEGRRDVLMIEYWTRTPENALRKEAHMDQLDALSALSREEWILNTTLKGVHVAIEPNLFPYETPAGVSHHTLWSRTYLYDDEVESFIETWLNNHRPQVKAWAWDPSNLLDGMSIDLYHVHVYLWEPPKRVARITPSRSRSHRALLPLPDPVSSSDEEDESPGPGRRRLRSRQ